jgi:cytidylate kinase
MAKHAHGLVIAVDGTAASGKGTLAKHLARAYDLAHLDTGSLYRGVSIRLLRQGIRGDIDPDIAALEASRIEKSDLNDPALRAEDTSAMASVIASLPEVRAALMAYQRQFAHTPPNHHKGAILDGRDIGTIILPNADFKFFCDASPEIRAERRYKELLSAGETAIYADILVAIKERDHRDMTRQVAPLRPAEDAIHIDTGQFTVEDMVARAMQIIASSDHFPPV